MNSMLSLCAKVQTHPVQTRGTGVLKLKCGFSKLTIFQEYMSNCSSLLHRAKPSVLLGIFCLIYVSIFGITRAWCIIVKHCTTELSLFYLHFKILRQRQSPAKLFRLAMNSLCIPGWQFAVFGSNCSCRPHLVYPRHAHVIPVSTAMIANKTERFNTWPTKARSWLTLLYRSSSFMM